MITNEINEHDLKVIFRNCTNLIEIFKKNTDYSICCETCKEYENKVIDDFYNNFKLEFTNRDFRFTFDTKNFVNKIDKKHLIYQNINRVINNIIELCLNEYNKYIYVNYIYKHNMIYYTTPNYIKYNFYSQNKNY